MSQYGTCTHCGSNLTPEDFQKPACRYCGTAFLHHQQAAAKVAELQAVMGMMRPPMPYGVPPPAPGTPVVVPGMVPVQHASAQYVGQAPAFGASPPPGGPMPASPPPGMPVGAPGAKDPSRTLVIAIVVVFGGLTLLGVIAGVLAVVLAR